MLRTSSRPQPRAPSRGDRRGWRRGPAERQSLRTPADYAPWSPEPRESERPGLGGEFSGSLKRPASPATPGGNCPALRLRVAIPNTAAAHPVGCGGRVSPFELVYRIPMDASLPQGTRADCVKQFKRTDYLILAKRTESVYLHSSELQGGQSPKGKPPDQDAARQPVCLRRR